MYAKLFTSIYQGTLRGDSHGLLVFTNLLAHADVAGHVDIHPKAISEEVGLSLEQVKAALCVLESPDPESRSPEQDGRRILRLDVHRAWGWSIVNHAKYRAIRNEDDRREQNRRSQANYRAKLADSNQSKPRKPPSAHTEADTEAEAKADAIQGAGPLKPPSPTAPSGKPARKRADKPVSAGVLAWGGYSSAYERRYGVEPVRNASVNAKLALFAGKLAEDEAAEVAAFYVGHQNKLYVGAMHPVDLLLRDAERLRTEWATGRVVTATQATNADKTQTNFNSFAPLIEEARRRDLANGAP